MKSAIICKNLSSSLLYIYSQNNAEKQPYSTESPNWEPRLPGHHGVECSWDSASEAACLDSLVHQAGIILANLKDLGECFGKSVLTWFLLNEHAHLTIFLICHFITKSALHHFTI